MMTSQNIAQSEYAHTGTDASHDACAHMAVKHHTVIIDGAAEQFLRSGAARNSSVSASALGVTNAPRQYANTSSSDMSARRRRYRLRDGARLFTTLSRVRACGKTTIGAAVELRASGDGSRVGYGGLSTCGSVWACPVCAAKISARRRDEVAELVAHAQAEGAEVSMLTLTMRHHHGQQLEALWDALSYGWSRLTSGRAWQQFVEQAGIVGYVKSTEITYSDLNGWHVHLHVLVVTNRSIYIPIACQRAQGRARQPYPIEYRLPKDIIAERWEKALKAKGVEVIPERGGVDWDVASDAEKLANYVTKFGNKASASDRISAEMTLGQYKKARKNASRTLWQVLEDAVATGDMDDIEVWQEYERVSRGRRAMTWSRGLREWAGLGVEQSDEEIAEEVAGDRVVALIDADSWHRVVQPRAAELLDALQEGEEHALAWLDAVGAAYCVERRE